MKYKILQLVDGRKYALPVGDTLAAHGIDPMQVFAVTFDIEGSPIKALRETFGPEA